MGGSVNVAIRLLDGTTVCQEHWTNATGYWLKRPALYESDQGARDYLAEYAGHDNDGYGSPQPVRNNSYGLIVVDYVTHVILDNNGYTEMDRFHPVKVEIEEGQSAFRECAAAGRLRLRETVFKRTKPDWTRVRQTIGDNLPPETAIETARRIYREDTTPNPLRLIGNIVIHDFVIDTHPFTVERFEQDDTRGMRARLREMGFPMTRAQGVNASR